MEEIVEKMFSNKEDREWALLQIKEDIEDMDDNRLEEYIKNTVKKGKLCWNHRTYEKLTNKEREYDTYLRTPPEVEEGVLQCKKCKSRKVVSYQVQTRSADEPMTTVAKCYRCGIGWTENN